MLTFPALVSNPPWSLSVLLLYYVATRAFGIPYLPREWAEVISKLSLLASGLKFLTLGDYIRAFLSSYFI